MRFGYTSVFLVGVLVGALILFMIFSFGDSSVTGFSVYGENSPSNYVGEEDIIVFDDYVVLRVANATISDYEDTGSMGSLFDFGANGIRVVPSCEEDVHVGDIVSFRQNGILIVHRVVEKGIDERGVYFVTKGDANEFGDGKIRFEDIEYKTIGVIW